jgi:hypothetical protein
VLSWEREGIASSIPTSWIRSIALLWCCDTLGASFLLRWWVCSERDKDRAGFDRWLCAQRTWIKSTIQAEQPSTVPSLPQSADETQLLDTRHPPRTFIASRKGPAHSDHRAPPKPKFNTMHKDTTHTILLRRPAPRRASAAATLASWSYSFARESRISSPRPAFVALPSGPCRPLQ